MPMERPGQWTWLSNTGTWTSTGGCPWQLSPAGRLCGLRTRYQSVDLVEPDNDWAHHNRGDGFPCV